MSAFSDYPGSKWWKMDYHAHTPASLDTAWAKGGLTLTPEAWLQKYMDAGIDCVAVTDHNSGQWIDRLKVTYGRMEKEQTAGFRKLVIFPGVELSVNNGVHILALFDPSESGNKITRLLESVDYRGTEGDSDEVSRESLFNVISAIHAAGGLAIPAHADNGKGLLRVKTDAPTKCELDTLTVCHVLEHPAVLAMEVINPAFTPPDIYTKCKTHWTRVLGTDCHNFQGPEERRPGGRFTWVKMGGPSLESLRLALIDGNPVSVIPSDDPPGTFQPHDLPAEMIRGIFIKEARQMGRGKHVHLSFNPWLNALVGGRGTGKSTVLHCLRLGLQREHELERLEEVSAPRKDFESFRKVASSRSEEGGLNDNTEICVEYLHQGKLYRIFWPTGEVQEWNSGTATFVAAGSREVRERFPLRIFSQGQIAALAGERGGALLGLVNDASGYTSWKERWDDKERAFFTLRTRMRELMAKLDGKDRLQARLEDVQSKLKRFEEAKHAEVLKAYQIRQRQLRETKKQTRETDTMVDSVKKLTVECEASEIPAGIFHPEDQPGSQASAYIAKLHAAVATARANLSGVAETLSAAMAEASEVLAGSEWHMDLEQTQNTYNALVETLKLQGVNDPSEYGVLVQTRQQLEHDLAAMEAISRELDDRKKAASAILDELLVLRRELSQGREHFLSETLGDNPYVRIAIQSYGRDIKALDQSLRELLGLFDGTSRFEKDIYRPEEDGQAEQGLVAELVVGLPGTDPGVESERRIDWLKGELLNGACGEECERIGANLRKYLQKSATERPELLDRILTWFPEDTLQVTYSPSGDGREFKAIQQGSAGQRSAAMLAFLLAYGHEPIVLDQPEDDLDNHLITSLVVKQIRENKTRRQIICVTHNPNIVVNGDAEMVHALEYANGQCRVGRGGSLQDKPVREEICQVMEGGREAFEQRYRRIGKGDRDV